eukprot:2529136-Amphidinium_carterae.3
MLCTPGHAVEQFRVGSAASLHAEATLLVMTRRRPLPPSRWTFNLVAQSSVGRNDDFTCRGH